MTRGSRSFSVLGGFVCLLALFLCAAPSQAATGSPAWRISQIAAPTVFKPGTSPQAGLANPALGPPLYSIYVTNVCPGMMRTGSPFNAWFKGRHRDEFAWFATKIV